PSTSPFTSTWRYSTANPSSTLAAPSRDAAAVRRHSFDDIRRGRSAAGRVSIAVVSLAARHGLQIRLLDRVGIDHDHLLVLDLINRRRVGIGLAVVTELDRGKERLELGIGEDVSHLVAIERAGL